MTYDEAIEALASALADAQVAAAAAWLISKGQDGAPVKKISDIYDDVSKLAIDAEALFDHGVTRAEYDRQKALYHGAKKAGMTP